MPREGLARARNGRLLSIVGGKVAAREEGASLLPSTSRAEGREGLCQTSSGGGREGGVAMMARRRVGEGVVAARVVLSRTRREKWEGEGVLRRVAEEGGSRVSEEAQVRV